MAPETPAPRYFTWDEVAQRSGRGQERWLVIERKVYNVSEFARRHPGGSRVMSHYAGQDATVSAPTGSGRGPRVRARDGKLGLQSGAPTDGGAGGARADLLPRDWASVRPGC